MRCTALYSLYYTAQHCTVLYCSVLYCTVLLCTILHRIILCYSVLYYTVLHCTLLYWALFWVSHNLIWSLFVIWSLLTSFYLVIFPRISNYICSLCLLTPHLFISRWWMFNYFLLFRRKFEVRRLIAAEERREDVSYDMMPRIAGRDVWWNGLIEGKCIISGHATRPGTGRWRDSQEWD